MGITSLRTRYAGVEFRSRLEARWAVFLDEAKIRWQYEPEWLTFSAGYNWRPDFLLACDQWAEVKGMLTQSESERLVTMAYEICECDSGRDVVVLGHLPARRSTVGWPVQLHRHGYRMLAVPWSPHPGCPVDRGDTWYVLKDGSFRPEDAILNLHEHNITELLLGGINVLRPSWANKPIASANSISDKAFRELDLDWER